jgi:hypothetical protein
MCFSAYKKLNVVIQHNAMAISRSITVLSVLVIVIVCVFIRFTFELECTVDYLVIVTGVGAQVIEKRG